MTPIQIALSNLDMVERLIGALTLEDVSTKEGKKIFSRLTKLKAQYSGKVRSYDFVGAKNG